MNKILIIIFSLICSISVFSQEKKGMDEMWGQSNIMVDALKEGRGKLFDESNFGMFIHWGLFSHLGGKWNGETYYGIGEWIMNPRMANIPVDEYKDIAKDFNPKEFDANAIAQLAKDAGMKYIIITSKHHEGFAMFKSEVDGFNIVDATPFARDPMHELAEACRNLGLGFGFYYSHNQDWTAPGGTRGPANYADGTPATFEDYFYKKCLPQVREICSNYGKIDFIWFDTPGDMKKELVVELVDVVRELQPEAMLCSRVGHGMGDYSSKGDMEVPARNIKGLWETCDTNNDSWSYAWYDNNFKSPKVILERLIATVARGGTYLFNVGPDASGVVPDIGVEFLKQTGEWIDKYPQVVYNAGASPWGHGLAWGDVTTQDDKLFLSVFEWPKDGKLYLPGLHNDVSSVNILNGNKRQKTNFRYVNEWTEIDLPFKAADSPVAVIEMTLAKSADDLVVEQAQSVHPNITNRISVEFADVSGAVKKGIRWMEKFGEWKHVTQVDEWSVNGEAEWSVNVLKPGFYYLDLSYKGDERLVWKAETDEGFTLQNQQAATNKYQLYRMGIIEFKTSGIQKIRISLIDGNRKTSSLEAIQITPIF